MSARFVGTLFEEGQQVRTGNGGLGRVLQVRSTPLPHDCRGCDCGDTWHAYLYDVEVDGRVEAWPWDYLQEFSILGELAAL